MNEPVLTYLTTTDLAAALQLTESAVVKLRENGTGPAFVRVGRTIRYPPWEVQKWIDQNKQTTRTKRIKPE